MVESPRARRRMLEIVLKEKERELRQLCLKEAELTGVLPLETPFEPGQSPPKNHLFTPKNPLLTPKNTVCTPKNTLFTKTIESMTQVRRSEDDAFLASLQQDCKRHYDIAEAALCLANDDFTSASLRRKHRLVYKQSHCRIAELEIRINMTKRVLNLDLETKPAFTE